jgi:hypothetical protein
MSGLNKGDLIYKLENIISKLGFLSAGHILCAEHETNDNGQAPILILVVHLKNLFFLLRFCKNFVQRRSCICYYTGL